MSIKSLIIVLLVSISIASCNSNSPENKPEEFVSFVAKVDSSMTLTQVAKANNIGEPYLRTKLGIRKNVGNKYTMVEMTKRFDFSIDDLKKIIEDVKNKQAAKKKPNKTGESSK